MVMRLTNLFAAGIAAVMLALGSGVVLSGCKSNDTAPAKTTAEPEKAAPAKPAPVKGAVAPASSKLAKVTNGMTPEQVQNIMGPPSGEGSYPTAKTFSPWGGYTNDTGNRLEYKYKGQGRVVFAVPRYGGNMKVVRVDYDPAEDGS